MKGEYLPCLVDTRRRHSISGVPVRVELGPNDLTKSQLTVVLRHTGTKLTIPVGNCASKLQEILEQIHKDLYTK